MFSHIALILSEKTSSLAISSTMVDDEDNQDTNYLTDGDNPTTDMGVTGTGDPWWIWIIVGVLIFALCACLGKFKAIYFLFLYYDNNNMYVVQLKTFISRAKGLVCTERKQDTTIRIRTNFQR